MSIYIHTHIHISYIYTYTTYFIPSCGRLRADFSCALVTCAALGPHFYMVQSLFPLSLNGLDFVFAFTIYYFSCHIYILVHSLRFRLETDCILYLACFPIISTCVSVCGSLGVSKIGLDAFAFRMIFNLWPNLSLFPCLPTQYVFSLNGFTIVCSWFCLPLKVCFPSIQGGHRWERSLCFRALCCLSLVPEANLQSWISVSADWLILRAHLVVCGSVYFTLSRWRIHIRTNMNQCLE